jgi:hypothetical protein
MALYSVSRTSAWRLLSGKADHIFEGYRNRGNVITTDDAYDIVRFAVVNSGLINDKKIENDCINSAMSVFAALTEEFLRVDEKRRKFWILKFAQNQAKNYAERNGL